jgi:hypothetical protein
MKLLRRQFLHLAASAAALPANERRSAANLSGRRTSRWGEPNTVTRRIFHNHQLYDGALFVCGDQSGRTSAPTRPHAVQIIFGQRDRRGISSGSLSAFMTALWLHHPDTQ